MIGKEPKLTSSRNLNQTFSHCQQLLPYTKSLEHLSGKQHCALFLKLQHQSKDDSSVAIGNLGLVIKSMTLRWRNKSIGYLRRYKAFNQKKCCTEVHNLTLSYSHLWTILITLFTLVGCGVQRVHTISDIILQCMSSFSHIECGQNSKPH